MREWKVRLKAGYRHWSITHLPAALYFLPWLYNFEYGIEKIYFPSLLLHVVESTGDPAI